MIILVFKPPMQHLLRMLFVGLLTFMTTTLAHADLKTLDIGKKLYKNKCVACHATGVASAPKLGDKASWATRIKAGETILTQHVIKGYKGMPPRGGCLPNICSDQDLAAAVHYMVLHVK